VIAELVLVLLATAAIVARLELLRRGLPVAPYLRPALAWFRRQLRTAVRQLSANCVRIARSVTRIALRDTRHGYDPHWAQTAGVAVHVEHAPGYRAAHRRPA